MLNMLSWEGGGGIWSRSEGARRENGKHLKPLFQKERLPNGMKEGRIGTSRVSVIRGSSGPASIKKEQGLFIRHERGMDAQRRSGKGEDCGT